MTEQNPQPPSRASVLMPALVEGAFDYLVPEGTPDGALVEARLAGRPLIGAVWKKEVISEDAAVYLAPYPAGGNDLMAAAKQIPLSRLKPITRVIDSLPPLTPEFRWWLDWVSEFTLAPKGAVLSLCGLAHAAKTTKKPQAVQQFTVTLPTLTADQQAVADTLSEMVRQGNPSPNIRGRDGRLPTPDGERIPPQQSLKPILLDGVTGSGKTEVYFHAIALAIMNSVVPPPLETGAACNQILVLLPEIALTHQWLERFKKTFGATPVMWHSRMTAAAKARAWQAIARGDVQVVVGARSALFLPFANLRLIIVDEEHDPSYKQEDGVLYHARDMAVMRAHCERIPIILASATPSLETLENVREGKYRALHLSERFGAAGLPVVRLVDMRSTQPECGDFISPIVKQAMLETLARGEQVLFFLNRRGYAPLLLCRGCGHRFQCRNCSAWLVVHGGKSIEDGLTPYATSATHTRPKAILSCHHCGHKEPMPKSCQYCGALADKLAPCGPGVERIVEEVMAIFTSHQSSVISEESAALHMQFASPRLALLSSDESIPPQTWAAIEAGEIDIIVGTQMVAKGHHFPRLTLVVVVDADVGLDGADLRAGERSYQLLHQLGGRAGRGELTGTVLVQTYAPEHPVMQALVAHDREQLMALEAQERKAGGWPPFGQLAAILLDGADEAKVRSAGQTLARTAPEDARLRVLGPAPAPLSKLRGQYRYRLLVKARTGIHLQRTMRGWLAGHKFPGVRIKVDVNPYYFL